MQSLRAYLVRISLPINRVTLQIMAAFLGAAFVYLGFVRLDQSRANFYETIGWLGLALLCLAVVVWDGARPRPTTWPARLAAFLWSHWWEVPLVLAIAGFAVFMFTFRFGEFPPSDFICCEENQRGAQAHEILEGVHGLISPLIMYPVALGFLLFGENTLGLRFFFLVAGVLMVPVFYLLLRELVRPQAALFATVLLASSWPLAFIGFGSQTTYLATMLLAYLLILGIVQADVGNAQLPRSRRHDGDAAI